MELCCLLRVISETVKKHQVKTVNIPPNVIIGKEARQEGEEETKRFHR